MRRRDRELDYQRQRADYWQDRATRAEAELERQQGGPWPLYRPGAGRPWVEPPAVVTGRP